MSLDIVSISSVGISGVLLVVGWLYLKKKIERMEKDLPSGKDLLRFFVPGEELTGTQVFERMQERTGGRRNIWLSLMYSKLDDLVKQGILCSRRREIPDTYEYDPDGDVMYGEDEIQRSEVTVYFLPQPSDT